MPDSRNITKCIAFPACFPVSLVTADLVPYVAAFRDAFREAGYVEDQNMTVEYHWLGG
jgi:hypothetical protein